MAYPQGKLEHVFNDQRNLNVAGATGDKTSWAPSYGTWVVRAVGAVITTACTGTAGVLDFDYRPTAGSDTNRVSSGGVARLNIANTLVAGNVLYKDGLNQVVKPGAEVVVKLTTAMGTAGAVTPVIYLELQPADRPGNNANLIATT